MDSALIEVALGLALIYLLFSLSVTSLNESISALSKLRGRTLFNRLNEIFAGDANEILDDTLLKALSKNRRPSYIPPKMFGAAFSGKVQDYAKKAAMAREAAASAAANIDTLEADAMNALNALPAGLRSYTEAIVEGAIGQTPAEFVADIERRASEHFDALMDRISGIYARQMKLMSAVIAILLVVILNIDTIRIANVLMIDDALRASITQEAAKVAGGEATPDAESEPRAAVEAADVKVAALPIGWTCDEVAKRVAWPNLACEFGSASFFSTLLGWALSSLAIMLGRRSGSAFCNECRIFAAPVESQRSPTNTVA